MINMKILEGKLSLTMINECTLNKIPCIQLLDKPLQWIPLVVLYYEHKTSIQQGTYKKYIINLLLNHYIHNKL
jgi:hypothetical protein